MCTESAPAESRDAAESRRWSDQATPFVEERKPKGGGGACVCYCSCVSPDRTSFPALTPPYIPDPSSYVVGMDHKNKLIGYIGGGQYN